MNNKNMLKGFLTGKLLYKGFDIDPDDILKWLVEFEELNEPQGHELTCRRCKRYFYVKEMSSQISCPYCNSEDIWQNKDPIKLVREPKTE